MEQEWRMRIDVEEQSLQGQDASGFWPHFLQRAFEALSMFGQQRACDEHGRVVDGRIPFRSPEIRPGQGCVQNAPAWKNEPESDSSHYIHSNQKEHDASLKLRATRIAMI